MNFKKHIAFILLFFCVLNINAQEGGDKITLSFTNISLSEAMKQIEKVSGYTFFYDAHQVNVKQEVSLSVKNASIETALTTLLTSTSLTFKITNKQIALIKKANVSSRKGVAKKITGLVLDDKGEPIIGSTVLIKGTINGALTNLEGKYTIDAREGDIIEYRFIGYNSIEKKVHQENEINVVLSESNVNLDDVVVIGYGSQKKESVVASVNSIKPADISMPTRSLRNTIAGQVAGVIAIQRSGEPGNDDASFWIRGQSSYAGGNAPLVLVDGVPRSMNDIDVDEIESFNVLKDAAATAVYGSEGANGVVLITSKRGRAQKTIVNFSTQYSVVTPTRMPELMPARDYLSMWNEASWNDAGNPDWNSYNRPYSDSDLDKYSTGVDTDLFPNTIWTDLLSKNTHNQRYTLNFRGGSEKTKFFVSGAYYAENGIFKSNPIESYDANIGLERYNIRSNVDMDITPTTKLSVDISGQYKTKNNPGNSSDAIFKHIMVVPTHLIPMQWSDGTASTNQQDGDGRNNPYNLLNYSGYTKNWSAALQSKVALSQKLDFITKGLSVRGAISFDADFSSTMVRSKSPQTFYVTGRDEQGALVKVTKQTGSALSDPDYSANSGSKNIYIETQLDYKRIFGKIHDVAGVLVYNQKETQYQGSKGVTGGLTLLPYRKQNIVARGSYAYDGRYVLEASFGATGSENFAANHRWGVFPAIGAAWNMSSEKFMQGDKIEKFINKLRLRASYGVTGNDNTGTNRFSYREKLTNSGSHNLGLNAGDNGGATGDWGAIYENTFAAPALTWEVEKKLNMGIDLGLFSGRVDMTFDYFSNRRENILIERVTIPTATGFRENPWQNFGITTNEGFDASLVLKQTIGEFKLSARGNITYAKNTIVEKDEIPQMYDWLAQTGQPIGLNKVFIAAGLYTPDDFNITQNSNGSYKYTLKDGIAAYANNVQPGDIRYKDLDGNGAIDSMDKTYMNGLYPNNPQVVYGFGFNAEYKGFFVGIFFQGVAKASTNLLANASYFMPFNNGRDESSARMEAAGHWNASDPYNQNVLYPRLHTAANTNNTQESTWWYRDASFLRLKNVELGYQFDKRVIQKIKMQNLRVFVQGTNLAVWDNIKMWDPELGNSGSRYPICGTWTLGLEVTF